MTVVAYSSILQDFIQPLCSEKETQESFYQKCEVGMMIWNYCIANEFNLPIREKLNAAIAESNELHPEMKQVLILMAELKKVSFNSYKNYIVRIQNKKKEDGSRSLYVESIPPDKFKAVFTSLG